MKFSVSQEPRLRWKMLRRTVGKREVLPVAKGHPTYSVFWARNAIFHCLTALNIVPGDKILVPSFHCASAIEPVLSFGAKVDFYNVKRDCSADFADIERKIEKQTRAILAIHYFGFPQEIDRFQHLCRRRKLYLIEDCAHVLSGRVAGDALGSFGDVSIFSWRKFLPIYDGGYLVLNNPALRLEMPSDRHGWLFSMKVAKNIFDKLIEDSEFKFLSYIMSFPYWLARRFLRANSGELDVLGINNRSLDFDMALVNLKMSRLSKFILRNIDLSGVIEKRRANYHYLLRALGPLPGITLPFGELSEALCPWVFPILVAGYENFHLTLRSKGIPASTWGGVIHPQLNLNEFPDAAFLYQNLILLPIHQDLSEADLQRIVEILTGALVEENSSGVYHLAAGGTL